MCCFSTTDVFLEDPPPEKKKEEEKKEEKKEEKVKKNYVLVSDQLHYQPITSPAPMYYPGGSAHVQFYESQLAPEPTNFHHYQGLTTQQVNDRNISRAQSHGGFNQVKLVPQDASPDNEYLCREVDGSWTLRTVNTIVSSLNPGQWAHATNGDVYWVRHAKN